MTSETGISVAVMRKEQALFLRFFLTSLFQQTKLNQFLKGPLSSYSVKKGIVSYPVRLLANAFPMDRVI